MPNFPKMNPEVKERWIAALRSGKYKQGESYLLHEIEEVYNEEVDDYEQIPVTPTYCCLGVLCDLEGSPERLKNDKELPEEETIKWAGLTTEEVKIPGHQYPLKGGSVYYLANLNDGGRYLYEEKEIRKYSFEEIADWIENNL